MIYFNLFYEGRQCEYFYWVELEIDVFIERKTEEVVPVGLCAWSRLVRSDLDNDRSIFANFNYKDCGTHLRERSRERELERFDEQNEKIDRALHVRASVHVECERQECERFDRKFSIQLRWYKYVALYCLVYNSSQLYMHASNNVDLLKYYQEIKK